MINRKCQLCKKNKLGESFKTNSSVSSDGIYQPFPIDFTYCNYCGSTNVIQDGIMRERIEKFYCEEYVFLQGSKEEEPCEITEQNVLLNSDSLVSFLLPYTDPTIHNSILDVGAGKGNFLSALHKKKPNIEKHAIEPSSAFKYLSNLSFLMSCQNIFFDSTLYKKRFNILSLIGVLEHVFSPVDFLLDIKKVLQDKKSLVLIEVPNFENNKSDLLTFDHLFKYTERSFENIVNLSGFSILARRVKEKRVPMQFILRPSRIKPIIECSGQKFVIEATKYIKFIISETKKISTKQIAVYGQGLLLPYLLGVGILKHKNIQFIIDDNPLYHNTLYHNTIQIISYDAFIERCMQHKIDAILLAMNDCYHTNILSKLKNAKLNIPIIGRWG